MTANRLIFSRSTAPWLMESQRNVGRMLWGWWSEWFVDLLWAGPSQAEQCPKGHLFRKHEEGQCLQESFLDSGSCASLCQGSGHQVAGSMEGNWEAGSQQYHNPESHPCEVSSQTPTFQQDPLELMPPSSVAYPHQASADQWIRLG